MCIKIKGVSHHIKPSVYASLAELLIFLIDDLRAAGRSALMPAVFSDSGRMDGVSLGWVGSSVGIMFSKDGIQAASASAGWHLNLRDVVARNPTRTARELAHSTRTRG